MQKHLTGAQIRQQFIDFFVEHKHTFVPSSSLVPGGDQTLLFTNAGMVQFKDVFLGTDTRPYTRAVDSQKCMRVAGKHNDLDDVGRDDTHHTFFEMLGNWSFGDYYKKEAITWAWQLLTDVYGLDKSRLWTTCFKDDKGNIPTDDEAFNAWVEQPGIDPSHVLYFGRKENFWEMAETGPCGPCSEIHIDRGPQFCNKQDVPGHVCAVNGDCTRFTELWNNVFIQYNRLGPDRLEPLPARHVDTGMGLDRLVAVLQGVDSNYKTDMFLPILKAVQEMTGHSDAERDENFTPYRVIADHARGATFLIADGVVPGNTGRNYVCRMIIRRAARFGTKIGLHKPFLAPLAEVVIDNYGAFYPELRQNRTAILSNLTREEERFRRTLDSGMNQLEILLNQARSAGESVLDGHKAFDLYATNGLPFELTRDVAREQGMDVDETGFRAGMEEHRIASGAGKAFGPLGGEDVDVYRVVMDELRSEGKWPANGIEYDPYNAVELETTLLGLIHDGELVDTAAPGDRVEVILPRTGFYVESGGQVSDTGSIIASGEPFWEIRVDDIRKPAAGVIVHIGEVVSGQPKLGDAVFAQVDRQRRQDIMRNHTATHLLHAALHEVLGTHARQAGSLVAPDRLRFDFNHPDALSARQLEQVESIVNAAVLQNYHLNVRIKPLSEAMAEGAMALFGEKYGETVRTITIGEGDPFSYELCGGTHVGETGDIGLFLITSEGSAAAGVRRIEAVTGRGAYELVQRRFRALKQAAGLINSSVEDVPAKLQSVLDDLDAARKQVARLRQENATALFAQAIENAPVVEGVPVLAHVLPNADADTLRAMTDRFRQRYPSSVTVLGTVVDGRPLIIAAVTDDLVKRGLSAGEIVKTLGPIIGGSGGGRPQMAQAGGKDPNRLSEAMDAVAPLLEKKLKG